MSQANDNILVDEGNINDEFDLDKDEFSEDDELEEGSDYDYSSLDSDDESSEFEQISDDDALNALARAIKEVITQGRFTDEAIRHALFDTQLASLARSNGHSYENVLMGLGDTDTDYATLLSRIFSDIKPETIQQYGNEKFRPILIQLLSEAMFSLADGDVLELTTNEENEVTEEEVSQVDDTVDMDEVNAITTDILNALSEIYQPCFVSKPLGILTSEGVLRINPTTGETEVVKASRNYHRKLYAMMSSKVGGFEAVSDTRDIDNKFFNPDGTLRVNYAPSFHVRNIFGYSHTGEKYNTFLEFKVYLERVIGSIVLSVLKHFPDDNIGVQNALKALFTNIIILDDFDRVKSFQLRFKSQKFRGDFSKLLDENVEQMFAITTGAVVSSMKSSLGVHNILYVFDKQAFNKEILFAYKAVEKLMRSGSSPSASNVLLGRSMDGTDYSENLADAGNIVLSIIAGSRSGKGVVTLSLLASLIADDCPVLYLDHKPDMASALWNFERSLHAKGVTNARIFAIDSLANQKSEGEDENGKTKYIKPVRNYPLGYNKPDVGLDRSDFALVPYLKTIQFTNILANLRANYGLSKKNKLFLVMDEAQKFNISYNLTMQKLYDIAKTKTQKGEEEPFEVEYAKKFIDIFHKQLYNGIQAVSKTTGGTGLVGFIVLGQTATPDEWIFTPGGSWKKGPFGNLIANTSIKLIGRDSGTSPGYGMPTYNFPGSEFKDDRGYFVRVRGSKNPERGGDTAVKMIKTYLVLNDNDFDLKRYQAGDIDASSYTGGILTNTEDQVLRERIITGDFLDSNGNLRESIGFAGLMKLLMNNGGTDSDLGDKMSRGYNLIWEVMQVMGLSEKYPDVESYLFDCSIESFYTDDELEYMYLKGTKQLNEGAEGSEGYAPVGVVPKIDYLDEVTINPDEDRFYGRSSDEILSSAQHVISPKEEGKKPQSTATHEDSGTSGGTLPPIIDVFNNTTPHSGGTMSQDELNRYYDDGETDNSQKDSIDTVVNTPTVPPRGFDGEPQNGGRTRQEQSIPVTYEQRRQAVDVDVPLQERSASEQSAFSGAYNHTIDIGFNPFEKRRRGTFSLLSASLEMTRIILTDLENVYGDLSRIEQVEITSTKLIFNNRVYSPRFPREFLDKLPVDMLVDVERGNIGVLLHYGFLRKFNSMHTLIVENVRFAENKLARDLELPKKLTWYSFIRKMPILEYIQIGSTVISDKESNRYYETGAVRQTEVQDKLIERFNVSKYFPKKPLDKVWKSTPVKIATGALGATAGVKAIGVGVAIFGGWGLLFGAFAGYGAYKKYIKNR